MTDTDATQWLLLDHLNGRLDGPELDGRPARPVAGLPSTPTPLARPVSTAPGRARGHQTGDRPATAPTAGGTTGLPGGPVPPATRTPAVPAPHSRHAAGPAGHTTPSRRGDGVGRTAGRAEVPATVGTHPGTRARTLPAGVHRRLSDRGRRAARRMVVALLLVMGGAAGIGGGAIAAVLWLVYRPG